MQYHYTYSVKYKHYSSPDCLIKLVQFTPCRYTGAWNLHLIKCKMTENKLVIIVCSVLQWRLKYLEIILRYHGYRAAMHTWICRNAALSLSLSLSLSLLSTKQDKSDALEMMNGIFVCPCVFHNFANHKRVYMLMLLACLWVNDVILIGGDTRENDWNHRPEAVLLHLRP